jgi:hypothetical protein
LECKLCFSCADFLTADLSQATVIYLYGTCLKDTTIDALADRFSTLSKEVKIITVSFPLSDYSSSFVTRQSFIASFPWGKGEVYLNSRGN